MIFRIFTNFIIGVCISFGVVWRRWAGNQFVKKAAPCSYIEYYIDLQYMRETNEVKLVSERFEIKHTHTHTLAQFIY